MIWLTQVLIVLIAPPRITHVDDRSDNIRQAVNSALELLHVPQHKRKVLLVRIDAVRVHKRAQGAGGLVGGLVYVAAGVHLVWVCRLPEHAQERLGNHLAVQGHNPSPVVQLGEVLVDLLLLLEEVVGEGDPPVDLVQARLDIVYHGEPLRADEVQEDLCRHTDWGRRVARFLEVEVVRSFCPVYEIFEEVIAGRCRFFWGRFPNGRYLCPVPILEPQGVPRLDGWVQQQDTVCDAVLLLRRLYPARRSAPSESHLGLFLIVLVPEVVAVEITIQSSENIELFGIFDAISEELIVEKVPCPHVAKLKPILASGNYVEIGWITPPVACSNARLAKFLEISEYELR